MYSVLKWSRLETEASGDDAFSYIGGVCFCTVLREHCLAEGALMSAYRVLNQVAAELLIHYSDRLHTP